MHANPSALVRLVLCRNASTSTQLEPGSLKTRLGLECFLQLVQLVLDLPHLLVCQSLLLLALLELLLQVLDLLLLVLVTQGCVLLDLDLVARAVVDLIGASVAVVPM